MPGTETVAVPFHLFVRSISTGVVGRLSFKLDRLFSTTVEAHFSLGSVRVRVAVEKERR